MAQHSGRFVHVVATLVIALAGSSLVDQPIAAQTPRAAPRPGEIATDPIRCWWRTDRTAIRVGERFTIALTCGVVEAGAITVVPNLTQLDAGAIGLTPYEVVSGTRHEDLVAPPWRYFQFEYDVRLLGDGFFGQDVNVPSLTVIYNVQQGTSGPQGRDQNYVLPALPMRVISLVPRAAGDIRDSSRDTFAAVEAHRFQSTAIFTGAAILFGFAALLVVIGGVRAFGGVRQRASAAVRPVPAGTLLAACFRDLRQLRSDAGREGWTPALARRVLATLRIAGAVALNRPVAETYAARDVREREGQLLLRVGLLRPKRVMVSAATTAQSIASRLATGAATGAAPHASLQELQDALQTFNGAAYSRSGEIDGAGLDASLEEAMKAIRRLRVANRWPMRFVTKVTTGGHEQLRDLRALRS